MFRSGVTQTSIHRLLFIQFMDPAFIRFGSWQSRLLYHAALRCSALRTQLHPSSTLLCFWFVGSLRFIFLVFSSVGELAITSTVGRFLCSQGRAMASCSSCCQQVSSAGVGGFAASRRNEAEAGAGRAGVQVPAGRLQLRERRMVVCGEDLGGFKGQSLQSVQSGQSVQRRWRGGSCGGSVTVSANVLATELQEERAGKSEAPVILEVQGLRAVVADTRQEILNGVDLVIREGEVHAIMGKNGSGKSTLSKVLVGHPDYEVTGGTAMFKGENLFDKEPEERSHCGLFLSFQSPVEIPGVSNMDFLRMACNARRKARKLDELGPLEFYGFVAEKLAALNMDPKFLDRNVNEGFSGGEKKRNEILQLSVLEADMAILDEIDSGLDIDALRDVATAVVGLKKENNAVLMITHYQRMLDYITPTFVHIMEAGRIVKTGDMSLASKLEAGGYNAVQNLVAKN